MNINFIQQPQYTVAMQSRKLIPLKEYKGTLLKLTAEDNKKIAHFLKTKAQFELELEKLIQLSNKKKISDSEKFYYDDKKFRLEGEISRCAECIKAIKKERLQSQKLNEMI